MYTNMLFMFHPLLYRMPLPDYPIPELDVTLQEASRVLQLTLNPDQYQRYETALLQQKDALQEVQEQLKKRISGRENWGTEEFKKQLLSWCDPLPNSNAVPSVLPSSKLKGEFTQIERATALLWAAANQSFARFRIEEFKPINHQTAKLFFFLTLKKKNQMNYFAFQNSFQFYI
uniref:Choline/carnitine acyltransferase domain-containing protein n=1 Tax=Cyprinus carpio TaxID=7962 RepID=A0A8C2IWW4_CYPCA